jgi:DNA-directed RNA polymerase subunit A'
MEHDIREIKSISFGVYSPEEIINMAVCKVDNTKLNGEPGSVYDERMGTIENGKTCPTCNQTQKHCIGHFGFIELNEPIIHPLFYKEVREILSFFCIKCYRLLITKEHIKLHSLGKSKIRKILKDRKFEECSHCEHPQPEFKYLPTENSISMVYKQKSGKVSIVLTVEEIKTTLDNIIDEDLEILGIKPNLNHPKNMIMTVFPVIPTTCRPWVIADGNYCDDDLTNQLIEIIKSNNYLSKDEPNMSESKRQKHLQSLKFRIATFYNNSSGKSKHSTSGRPVKGLKERITGKSGQIRSHLMGN